MSTLGKHWKLSVKRRKECSKIEKGDKHWNWGKHLSEKTKKLIGDLNRGEKSGSWKGGIEKYNAYFKRGEEYKQWRKLCLERDNFTCQICGHYGGKMIVHHILNFAEYLELRTCMTNGITFCEKCHKEFHHIYGTKNNTQEQLNEFLNKKGHSNFKFNIKYSNV